MAAVSEHSVKMFRASESCSVCLDAVSDSGERSIAILKCGHQFHLDCIGSAFNAKGAMQCPNCRHVENGQWLYANGSRWNDDYPIDESPFEDDPYEGFQTLPALLAAHDPLPHLDWCPYQHGSLPPDGSSYEQVHFSMPFRDLDGPVRILPEVVVNVSYNYNESGGASDSPPVCPYLEAQARQSQGTEDSRLRPPMAGRPTRPLDPSAASNSGSSTGSLIGDGDLLPYGSNIWGPRLESLNSFSAYRTDPSIFGDQPRPQIMDFPFLPRNSSTVHGDTGSGPPAHERSNSWSRSEAERVNNQGHGYLGTYNAQHSQTELHVDSGPLTLGPPCPRPRFAHGQVGTSQSQPQSSSLRGTPIGSNRRSRQNPIVSPSISGGRSDPGHTTGDLRRFGHSWTDLSLALGQEPPVPGLESHGSGHQNGGQSFVPWRRESTTGPSSSLWTPGQLWHPPTRASSGLSSNSFRHSEYIEGHGSSQLGLTLGSTQAQSTQHQSDTDLHYPSSLFSSFGLDGAAAGSSIPHRIHVPTPYNITLRPR